MEPLLTIELLAIQINKSVASIRSDASRNPKALPPICRLPGTRRLLWRKEDVMIWQDQHVAARTTNAGAITSATNVAVKRGRPTKRQQLEANQSKLRG